MYSLANKTDSIDLRKSTSRIDWKLLLFLLLFLNVKLIIKAAAIVIICLLQPDFKFGFRFRSSRLPLFYPIVIAIAIFNWIIGGQMTSINYSMVVLTGILFWLAALVAIHQVKLMVDKNDPAIIHRTIIAFFIINAFASLAVYASIVWETGTVNPFRYQGNFQQYFIGTGDYIKGISFDTSTTNAVLNAFGVLYFLQKKQLAMLLTCTVILLLTGSNITNLLLCCSFIFLFIFKSDRDKKSLMLIVLSMLLIFIVKISPQNNNYIAESWRKLFHKVQPQQNNIANKLPVKLTPDSLLTSEEIKQKTAILYLDSMNKLLLEKVIATSPSHEVPAAYLHQNEKIQVPADNIHTPAFQHRDDTTALQRSLWKFILDHRLLLPLAASSFSYPYTPGKIVALQQTLQFFQQHPFKILTGNGIGNFSSKLAFRSTALKISGGYPVAFAYTNSFFLSNHLDAYLSYFSRNEGLRSVSNTPNSVYDQLWSEYGIAGLIAFVLFYAGYFLRYYKQLTYGISLLLFMAGIFFLDYWFEQLSVVVFFELLLLLNIKETNSTQQAL